MRILILAAFLWTQAAGAFSQQVHNLQVEAVIARQIEAFQSGELESAFGLASPAIRDIFETPQKFAVMVRRGYPMVWEPEAFRFLDLREIDGKLFQLVVIEDKQGRFHLLHYEMLQVGEEWRINGVQLVREPTRGA